VTTRASDDTAVPAAPRLPMLLRIVRNHVRLFSSLVIGIVAFALEPLWWQTSLATRYLVAWDVFVILFLVEAVVLIARFDVKLARQRAVAQDDGGLALLVLTIGASVMSLVAIVAELGAATDGAFRTRAFLLVLATITLSWVFVQVIFALHYAHEYFDEGHAGHAGGGLQFPDDDHPEYWDFLYFSVVIGMTFQVSDVQVTSKPIRRLVMAHGLVSFVFNVAILALLVNLGANLIGTPKSP
jgi:uncharacterized membrane protein